MSTDTIGALALLAAVLLVVLVALVAELAGANTRRARIVALNRELEQANRTIATQADVLTALLSERADATVHPIRRVPGQRRPGSAS